MTMRVLLVAALLSAALGFMIFDRQAMLDAGQVVTLRTAPVDPRDIFRGDYVVLRYEISNLDLTKLAGEDSFAPSETVFVALKQEGPVWTPVSVTRKKPAGVAVRGLVSSSSGSALEVTYGIESYFVPEGTGKAIEAEAARGAITVDAAIDDEGRAAIKRLRSDGRIFYTEGVF